MTCKAVMTELSVGESGIDAAEAKKRFNEKYGHEPKIYDVVISDGARKVTE